MTTSLAPSDERAHEPSASSPWSETWEWRVVDPVARMAVVVAVVRRPAVRRSSYVAAVLAEGRPTVAVIEHDVASPRRGLELRASGLWADHVCEEPFRHWSLGLEAFGLVLDDPDDAVRDRRGTLVPVGADLEWEDAEVLSAAGPGGVDSGYRTVGRAHGELLVGDGSFELDGSGERLHRWGSGAHLPAWTSRAVAVDDLDPGTVTVPRAPARAVADEAGGDVVEWWLDASAGSGGVALVLASRRRP